MYFYNYLYLWHMLMLLPGKLKGHIFYSPRFFFFFPNFRLRLIHDLYIEGF